MSFPSWLRQLRSALAPRERHRGPRAFHRVGTHRLKLEVLEDRIVPAFLAPVDYTVGDHPSAMKVGDFNNDGRFDLVTANQDNDTVSVLLGNADGTFRPATTSATGATPVSLAVGDFDRDGRLDLATANRSGSDVSVLLGNGNGTFQAPRHIDVDSTPNSVAVGDFNGDGKLDLVVTSNFYSPDSYTQGLASVLLAVGDGSFSAPIIGNTPGNRPLHSEAVGDFNGDGKLDLVACDNSYAEILVLPGDGRGRLNPSGFVSSTASAHAVSMVTGDLNGDGKLDLVMASGYDVGVLQGNGWGGFGSWYPEHYAAGSEPTSVALGDFNRDGVLDIAAANLDSTDASILLGRGDGTFLAAGHFAAGPGASAVAAGDFSGDGWLDLTTANTNGNSDSVLINDRSGPFVPPTVSVSDAAVTEGNAGAVNATFTVTLSKAAAGDVTVHYATADDSAVAGSDYTAASGTVVIPAGQTGATVTIAVRGDRLPEPDETFAVNLSAATNATIGDAQGIGTIRDNEPRISISDVTRAEGKKNKTTLFTFTVTLSVAYDQPVTMSFSTVNGTATTADNDYVAQSGTLTFAPGEATKTITIVVQGDNKRESNEEFYVDLSGTSSNSVLDKKRGIGKILNDD
jgi:hypothetical protein